MTAIDPETIHQALWLQSRLMAFFALLWMAQEGARKDEFERQGAARPKLDYTLGLKPGEPVYFRSIWEVRYPPR